MTTTVPSSNAKIKSGSSLTSISAADAEPVREVVAEDDGAGRQRAGDTGGRDPGRVAFGEAPGVDAAPEAVGEARGDDQREREDEQLVRRVVERAACGLPPCELEADEAEQQ